MPSQPSSAAAALAAPPPARAELAQACRALWLATLSLMTAYMHTPAPAHRCLLARRIARNLATLAGQPDILGAGNCQRFERLATHWAGRAEHFTDLAANPRAAGVRRGWLNVLARLVAFPR